MRSIKDFIKNKQPILNGWLSEASSLKAEIMCKHGFDSITVDLQHGLQDYQQMCQAFYGMKESQVISMARVAWNQPEQIMKALDAGAMGIICPMINTKKEAEEFVSALYYPPLGRRSFGPVRAAVVYDDYYQKANEEIVGFAMIETKDAVENLDEILSVKNINGLYIGPSDLAIAYGFKPGFDRQEDEVLLLIHAILKKAKKHKVITAIHTDSADYAIKMIEIGFDMVTLSSDLRAMSQGLKQAVTPFIRHFTK